MDLSKPKHILIVDDDDGIRVMLENKLFKLGYKCSTAANGLHALQKIRTLEQYDLIVCDLKMPGMSGLDLVKSLREDSLFKELPVLLITGYPEKQQILDAVRTGISRVLLKPFKHHQIAGAIKEILNPEDMSGAPAAA
jgi:CheY-like chemotaxis protein